MRNRRSQRWMVPLLVFGAAVVCVCAVPVRAPDGDGDAAARRRVARAVRDAEPGFRRNALEMFPGDPWSQGDQFAAQERTLVEKLSKDERMRPGAIFDVIDRDVKRGHPTSFARARGRAAPCMPRPFYD
jgi:hypothetical protein